MEIFVVGGAVRDTLLGLTPKDQDYVVVGATPEDMLSQGYSQVGADFPVFLHPETGDEYALARTERKSGKGYNGFEVNAAPDVTLVDDLGRRDLTINSMAMTAEGKLVDPYDGQKDLKAKVLRHTTEAFHEDPLRLLRVARFLARYGSSWSVAPETRAMLQAMVEEGEVDYLTPERVWKEFEKGLSETYPVRMLEFLHELKVFERPPFAEYRFTPRSGTLMHLAHVGLYGRGSIAVRFALGMPRKWSKDEAKTSRLPAGVREVTHLVQHCEEFQAAGRYQDRPAEEKLSLLETLDAMRQKERFFEILEAMNLARPGMAEALEKDARKLWTMSSADAIGDCKNGKEIAQRIRAARLALL